MDASSGISVFMFLLIALYYLAFMGVFAVIYIFGALGMYQIAKRRGIEKPWLAWIPCGDAWILGSISDQYRYVTTGQHTNRRKKLLTWNIVLYAVLLLFCGIVAGLVGAAIVSEAAGSDFTPAMAVLFAAMFVLYFAMLAFAVVTSVLTYMATYDLFRSCNPSLAILFLMLSIFVAPSAFFIFAQRKRDDGMPPRPAQVLLEE